MMSYLIAMLTQPGYLEGYQAGLAGKSIRFDKPHSSWEYNWLQGYQTAIHID